MEKTRSPHNYLDLLVANYKEEDNRLLTKIARDCKNENDIHAIVDGYINIFTTNPTKACKEPLEIIYAKLTCGIHRLCIVNILIQNQVLSNQLKQEIQYDSYKDLRTLYASLK